MIFRSFVLYLNTDIMEVITIDSAAFHKLKDDLQAILDFIQRQQERERDTSLDDEMWIDNYDVCTFLKVSERTLQRLRAAKKISYSRVERHTYYQVKEIRRMLQNHLVRSNEEYLHDLIENQKLYAEQRRAAKPHK